MLCDVVCFPHNPGEKQTLLVITPYELSLKPVFAVIVEAKSKKQH